MSLKNTYIYNKELELIKDWPGNYVNHKGEFENLELKFQPNLKSILKWKSSKNEYKSQKVNYNAEALLIENDTSFLDHNDDVIIWLGHASFYIRVKGISILIDPVLDHPNIFLKRNSKIPFDISIFSSIDYILISHDHRDHLDKKSLKKLLEINKNVQFLTGLKMGNWLKNNLSANNYTYQEAGWYQKYQIPSNELDIYYLPAKHWSKRGLFDMNQILWGSFIIQTADTTIYFGGDTGYGSHLKEIGELFNKIDIAIMGIGAYQPEWFMVGNHISPTDALKAVEEMGAQHFIPMHYGTFDLSDEPLDEPLHTLKKVYSEKEKNTNLLALKIGENLVLNSLSNNNNV